MVPVSELSTDDGMDFAVRIVHPALGICFNAGPGDKDIVDKAFDILLQVPVLRSLDLFARHFLQSKKRMKLFGWEFKEEEYLHFIKTLTSHFKGRWLGIKRKSKAVDGNSSSGNRTFKKRSPSLDTTPEELDPSNITGQDHCCSFFGSGVGSLEIAPYHALVSQSNLNNLRWLPWLSSKYSQDDGSGPQCA